jgi:hypothetical protein
LEGADKRVIVGQFAEQSGNRKQRSRIRSAFDCARTMQYAQAAE